MSIYAQNRQAALAEVVSAENSFADLAAANNTRAAFLAFAADDGLMLNGKLENAKESFQKRAANAALLAWRPSWVDVSADGVLGLSTGSWSFSPNKTAAPVAWGEFFTIWKKQPDGSWKFVIDLGIGHDKADVVANVWKSPETAEKSKPKKTSADVWKTLENDFVESLRKKGAKKTYKKFASEQIRLLREGQMPFQGKPAALAQITDAQVNPKVLGGGASSDTAYSYGEYELTAADGKIEKGFYTRVWKLEAKGWRLAAEVANQSPPEKN